MSHNPALYLFLLNLLLISPVFSPGLLDLGPFDEINYLNGGRSLAEGWLPDLAFNPLVAALHAVGYLHFRASPFWIVHIAGFGRLVVFSILWLAAYVVGRGLAQHASPLIMGGTLLVSPLLGGILNNPSEALFAALSAFSFWQLPCFYQSKQVRHAGLASLFLGLAALALSPPLVQLRRVQPFTPQRRAKFPWGALVCLSQDAQFILGGQAPPLRADNDLGRRLDRGGLSGRP